MNRLLVNYLIDIGLLFSFVISAVTGIIIFPKLLQILGVSPSSLPISNIYTLHSWSGLAMALLAFVHIVLHWHWIVAMTKKYLRLKK